MTQTEKTKRELNLSHKTTMIEKQIQAFVFLMYLFIQAGVIIAVMSQFLLPFLVAQDPLLIDGKLAYEIFYLRAGLFTAALVMLIVSVPVLYPFYYRFMDNALDNFRSKKIRMLIGGGK